MRGCRLAASFCLWLPNHLLGTVCHCAVVTVADYIRKTLTLSFRSNDLVFRFSFIANLLSNFFIRNNLLHVFLLRKIKNLFFCQY